MNLGSSGGCTRCCPLTFLHPLGVGLLKVFGTSVAVLLGLLHGAGNGILTFAKGTLLPVVVGPLGYEHHKAC